MSRVPEPTDGSDKPTFEQGGAASLMSDGSDKPTFEQDEVEEPGAAKE